MIYLYPCKPKELPPMSELFDELDNDEAWIAEYKKNGWRCEIIKDDSSNVHIMTSNKTYAPLKIDLLPTLRHLPCGTQLDGEIILKARTGNKTEEFLYLFDVLMYDYKAKWMLPLYERKQILLSCFKDYLCMDSQIILAEGFTTGKKRLYEKALAQGDEGIVMKQLDSTYPIGYTRFVINPLWLKVKRIEKHVKTGGGL